MTFVNITALTFPERAEEEIVQRFAARPRGVDDAPGFQSFELLKPVYGEQRFFVVTRWESKDHFEAWTAQRMHGSNSDDEKRGMSVELLGFEVVQHDE